MIIKQIMGTFFNLYGICKIWLKRREVSWYVHRSVLFHNTRRQRMKFMYSYYT